MKRRAILAVILTAMTLFSVLPATAASSEKIVLTVDGMYCEGCAKGITAMLKRVNGILETDVSYEKREARVTFDPAKTSTEKLIEAIEKLGYKAARKK